MLALCGLASHIENGDTNGISMYFVVFLFLVLPLPFLNALFINKIEGLTNRWVKALLSFLPVIVLAILSQFKIVIASIDGNLAFVAAVGAISIGFTNAFWAISLLDSPKSVRDRE